MNTLIGLFILWNSVGFIYYVFALNLNPRRKRMNCILGGPVIWLSLSLLYIATKLKIIKDEDEAKKVVSRFTTD